MSNTQQGARLVYRNAVKSMIRAGVDPKNAVLSQSYLRFEQAIVSTKTQYQFGVLQNDTGNANVAVRPTEQRLALQDSFYCGSIQIMLGLATSASDTAFPVYTYASPTLFLTGKYTNYYNLWNSNLSLSVNNKKIATAWDCLRHYQVNQTQQSAVNPLATAGVLSQFNGGEDGVAECEPNWVLIGSKNNQLQINLNNAIDPATAFTYIVVVMRGVLAQNVTVVS